VNPQDDHSLARAIEHRRMMKSSLGAENRLKGRAPTPRAPTPAGRLAQVMEAVRSAYPDHERPRVKDIARTARCSLGMAREARRWAVANGCWPYPS
jgi:hypothetical protein